MRDSDRHYFQAQEIRKAQRQPDFLRKQQYLRTILADRGWYIVPDPEEGIGEALTHISDTEVYIVGYIMDDFIVLDPGEDYEVIRLNDYPTHAHFIVALETAFNKLVKVWFPE